MTKNRTPTPVYLDPGMHSGLEVKGLKEVINRDRSAILTFSSNHYRYLKIVRELAISNEHAGQI